MFRPTPDEQIIDWLDARTGPLTGEDLAVSEATGRVLAGPVAAPADHPAVPLAAADGYALASRATVGASDYNPLSFRVGIRAEPDAGSGTAQPVVSGQALPRGADTVMPLEETDLRGDALDVYAPLAAGHNVVAAGREARGGEVVLDAGRVLRAADLAMLIELGLPVVRVVRRPRVGIIVVRGDVPDAAGPMIRSLVARDGGKGDQPVHPGRDGLEAAIAGRQDDLLLVIGGSGPGFNDPAPAALAEAGELVFRGVAINPGETTTLGHVREMPVVLLPGPPLAALFAYDVIAGRAVRRLGGRDPRLPYDARRAVLSRKIASGLGRLECCRVRVLDDRAEPLAVADNRTLSTVVRADGFVLVPAQSEGFAAGDEVPVYMYDRSGPAIGWSMQ